ncbi:MAG: phosphoethanolamine transferase [Candidatus Deferrimicrobium sp.]
MTLFLASRGLAFLAVPGAYLLLGLLNYSQSGKSAVLGVLALLAAGAWCVGHPPSRRRRGARWEILVAAPFFALLAIQAFLRDYFGVAHNDEIVVEALFNTNGGEATEFLLHNSRGIAKHFALLVLFLLLYGLLLRVGNRILPSTGPVISRGEGERPAGYRARLRPLFVPFLFLALFLLLHLNPTMRQDDPLLYFPLRYLEWSREVEETRRLQVKLSADDTDPEMASIRYVGEGPRTVVLALGESTTRLNWSLYGYPRRTNPELSALGKELVRFDDVVTSYAGTSGSLRLLLTPADLSHPDLWETKPDLLTMARKAGYKTFWITNNGGRTGLPSVFASHADTADFTNLGGSHSEGSYDNVLLDPFRKALSDPAPRKFILLHMLGAHPVFHFRYPKEFARFDGEDDDVSREMKRKGRSFWAVQQRDEYDNAMLYADHLLRATIESCRERKGEAIAWLFTPDHGEDVAHYTDFVGHNPRVRAMWEVPLLFWRSKAFLAGKKLPAATTLRPAQTDTLDHTLLGLLAIRGAFYDPRRDLLSRAFEPVKRSLAGVPYP